MRSIILLAFVVLAQAIQLETTSAIMQEGDRIAPQPKIKPEKPEKTPKEEPEKTPKEKPEKTPEEKPEKTPKEDKPDSDVEE